MVKVGTDLDFRLAELLGENHLDCLVFYFDGKEAPWVGGTPPNTLTNRLQRLDAVNTLNKHGKQWRAFFPEWARMFREKMGLPETATAENYRPKISLKVHRVVAGYSPHLSAAVQLLESLAKKGWLKQWVIGDRVSLGSVVILKDARCQNYEASAETTARAISMAVCHFLESNPELRRSHVVL